jgi:hypothetical protein
MRNKGTRTERVTEISGLDEPALERDGAAGVVRMERRRVSARDLERGEAEDEEEREAIAARRRRRGGRASEGLHGGAD